VHAVANLLVTGGAGFIGSNFVTHWLGTRGGGRVVVLDALTYAGNRDNLRAVETDPRFTFVHGDICDGALVADLLRREQIDTLVHFAAETHVDRSIAAAGDFVRTNVLGTHALLEAARAAWMRGDRYADGVRFHHVSTDEVYGALGPGDAPFTEQHAYRPNSPYAASKAAADHLVRSFFRTHGLPVTTSHGSNTFGPFHFPEKLIPLTIVNALRGRPLPVYGSGENLRDWLYVNDHCKGIERVLERGRAGEAYNLGAGAERRNIDVVTQVCRLLDQAFERDAPLRTSYTACPAARGGRCESLLRFVADRPGHDWRYALDTSRAHRELGFTPGENFDSGLAKTVDWFVGNPGWWS